jgi:alpha-L-fucosidase
MPCSSTGGYTPTLPMSGKGKHIMVSVNGSSTKNLADIPVDEYKEVARTFNPTKFDADAIVSLAKNAGMKYIIITSKHHDGFAMFHSRASDFNIMDATPFGRDPMKELAEACKKQGLGFGFYYSQNQDWTAPGGAGGPNVDESGKKVTFEEYFEQKCLPQVREITTQYGDIVLVWFDTPGRIPKKNVEQLVAEVRKKPAQCAGFGPCRPRDGRLSNFW